MKFKLYFILQPGQFDFIRMQWNDAGLMANPCSVRRIRPRCHGLLFESDAGIEMH